MCELFGLSSLLPATVTMSMRVLARHGSHERHLDDGWGVAFHTGEDVLRIRRPEAADHNLWLDFLESQPVRSRIVISHIRHATQGEVSLRNTQPFTRELGGRMHVFAHNGSLPGFETRFCAELCRFRPVGSTDSEAAFCALLERLVPLWDAGMPAPEPRLREIVRFASAMRALGPANFLYTDGDLLVAHGDRRIQHDGGIAPPGLWMLQRECPADPDLVASSGVGVDTCQRVMLFASVPLTAEPWQPLPRGEIVAARRGSRLDVEVSRPVFASQSPGIRFRS